MRRKQFFRDVPIKQKLIYMCVITTAFALLLTSAVFVVYEYFTVRRSMVSELTAVANTIGKLNSAALVFGDRKESTETMKVLSSIPNIVYAATYNSEGEVFSEYKRAGLDGGADFALPPGDGYSFGITRLEVFRKVVFEGEAIGTIYIVSDLKGFYAMVVRYALLLLAITVCALFGSYLLSSRLQKVVTEPLAELTTLMAVISKEKDYTLRTDVAGRDEAGYLASGFNEMLETIQKRDEELAAHYKRLEELVEERTAELAAANKKLHEELSERFRVEEALRQSENMYRAIFENTGTASIIVEEDTTILLANTEFERLTGCSRSDLEGKKSWTEFIDTNYKEKMLEYHQLRRIDPESVPGSYESVIADRDGNKKNVIITVAVIPGTKRSIASVLDITNLKRLEEQLQQSHKMEAIGQLAGGVAHDFNNILTAIIGYGAIMQMKMEKENPFRAYVEPIMSAAEKAANLTQGLLAFSRKQLIAPRPININSVVRDFEKLIKRLIGEDVELVTSFSKEDLTVFADSGQIGQVLMNLAANARDAMPGGGRLRIATSAAVIDDAYIKAHNYGKPGKFVLTVLSDNGVGMSKEVSERIFEPFFTTKEVGKGTGLGLSIVYGIIKQHNGYIDVESEAGAGTTFRIYLPFSGAENEAEETVPAPKEVRGGNETILLCEDDAGVRAFAKELLEHYGYRIIEATDGEDAVRQFADNRDRIDLAIIDVIMPKKNGRVVYDEVKSIKPDAKAIFMSGYSADIIHKKGIFEKDIHFVTKPIIADQFLEKVRQVLDQQIPRSSASG